jgi:low affinity Fe/Cu permease
MYACRSEKAQTSEALQLKLDELIRATEGARNRLLQLEDLSEEEMTHIKRSFLRLAQSSPHLDDEVAD